MQLQARPYATREKVPLKGENVVNCLEFREPRRPHVHTLVKADPPKKRHKSDPGGYRRGIISQGLLGHCLALRGKSPSDTKTSWEICLVGRHNCAPLIHLVPQLFTLMRKKSPTSLRSYFSFFHLLEAQSVHSRAISRNAN